MNCLPWMLRWFSGLPSQKGVCPSTTKISLPSGVTYMDFSARVRSAAEGGASAPSARALTARSDVLQHLVHVPEQDHGAIVHPDHPAIMSRSVDLKGLGGHLAPEILADLVHLEDQ